MRLRTTLGAVALVLSGCASATSPAATSTVPPATPGLTEASPTPSPSTPEPTQSSAPAAGTWTATGNMITARAEFTATLLPDGKVLVAGGVADNTEVVELASAELYDPGTGTWSATGSMRSPRARHTATLLANGKVLVAGGLCERGTPTCPLGALAAAELYDPRSGKWSATGAMTTPRYLHTATLLKDGSVLVTGAEHNDGILASAEIYDPSTGKWTATGSMITARTQQFAVRLGDGKVLVFGGCCPVSPAPLTSPRPRSTIHAPGNGRQPETSSPDVPREVQPPCSAMARSSWRVVTPAVPQMAIRCLPPPSCTTQRAGRGPQQQA